MVRMGGGRAALLLLVGAGAALALALPSGRQPQAGSEMDRVVAGIRRRLMDELGLTHSPVKNATDEEIETVMREYRRLQAEQSEQSRFLEDSEEESTVELLGIVSDAGWKRRRRGRLAISRTRSSAVSALFALESAPLGPHDYIVGGTLRLHVGSARRARHRRPARLAVYELTAAARPGRPAGRRRLASRRLSADAAGWVGFNVTALAQQWRARPADNRGVLIECRRCGLRLAGAGARRQLAPRLTLRYRTVRRTRRSADFISQLSHGGPHDCNNRPKKSRCCRQKMEVNFKELGGVDYILQPASFSAYYCRGRCPASYNVATHHALLQGWIHQKRKNGDLSMPRTRAPCCVPSKLTHVLIVHLDAAGKPKMTYLNDAVAEECKCS